VIEAILEGRWQLDPAVIASLARLLAAAERDVRLSKVAA
jgi:hypothetical protein